MQFIIIGHDGSDDKALERRLAVRDAHSALIKQLKDKGNLLYGAAILDETEKMVGSMLVAEFESRAELDKWLEIEPYVIGKVWEKIDVKQCKVAASFALPKAP